MKKSIVMLLVAVIALNMVIGHAQEKKRNRNQGTPNLDSLKYQQQQTDTMRYPAHTDSARTQQAGRP